MHFNFYEDLKRGNWSYLGGQLEKLAKFFSKEVSKERLKEHLKFESIEKNEAINNEASRKRGTINEDTNLVL